MSSYRIEVFDRRSQLDAISGLRRRVFGGTAAFNRAYLKWKYLENPYVPEPLIYVAWLGDQAAGMRGFYGTSWDVPGSEQRLIIPCAADLGIAEDHRDRGLFDDLTDFAFADLKGRGFPYVINMSATPANYVTSIMAMGWKSLGSYEPLVRSTAAESKTGSRPAASISAPAIDRLRARLKASPRTRALVRRLRDARPKQTASGAGFEALDRSAEGTSLLIEVQPQPAVMAKIAANQARDARFSHVRDEHYFRWRYRNPASTYRFLFRAGDDPDAYLVLQQRAVRPTRLVDWGGREGGCAELLDELIRLAPPAQLSTWGATVSAPFRSYLGEAGFVLDKREGRRGMLVRDLGSADGEDPIGQSRPLDSSHWDLRMICSDRF